MKILKNTDYILLGLLTIYFGVTSIFKIEFIPDILDLTNHIEHKSIYESIIGTLTTILGLIAIVFIVFYEFLKNYSFKKSSSFFKDSREFQKLLVWSSATLVFSFIGLITIKVNIDSRTVTQLYFCIFIFLFSIYLIIPFAKSFLKLGDINNYTLSLVNNVNESTLQSLFGLKPKYRLEDQIKYDESEIGVLREIGKKHVATDNSLPCKVLINKLTDKIIDTKVLGGNRSDTGSLLSCLLYVFDGIRDQSFKSNNEEILIALINSCFRLYKEAAENKRELLHFENLDDWINDLIELLFINKSVSSLKQLNKHISDNVYIQLTTNCPSENEIFDIFDFETLDYKNNKNSNTSKDLQWGRIFHDYTNQLSKIYLKALHYKFDELIFSCSFDSNRLCKRILDSQVEDNLKGNIIWFHQQNLAYDLIDFAGENKLNSKTSKLPVLKPIELKVAISESKSYSHRLIETFYNLIRDLLKSDSIKFLFPTHTFNGVSRISTENYTKGKYFSGLLNYHIKYLNYYRTILEENLTIHHHNYDELRSEMEGVKKQIIENIKSPPRKLLKKVEKILTKFKSTEEYKKGEKINLERRRNES